MNLGIIRKKKSYYADLYAIHVPFILKSKCTKCNKEAIIDLNINFLYNPIIGTYTDIIFLCDHCNNNWFEKIKIDISITGIKNE